MASSLLCCSVLITGSNRGIGLELVKHFLKLSPPPEHIFATCRCLNADSAAELKKLASENPNVVLLQLDVVDFEGMKEVVGEVSEKLQGKGLNVLINNAGIIVREPSVEDVTVESMMNIYKTNTVARLMLTQAFLPLLKKASCDPDEKGLLKALVLNMSSKVGSIEDNKSGGMYSYRASKTAINVINKSLSVDLKPFGIMAVVLDPGWVKTDMGSKNALISTEESVSGMMKVIGSLDESKSGMFFDYTGNVVPW